MIRICYWPGGPLIRARGHAEAGPKGQDLICAAVTTLLLTLRENGRGRLEPGRAEVWGDPACSPVFEGIAKGFSLLARQYPRHLQFLRYGDREESPKMIE